MVSQIVLNVGVDQWECDCEFDVSNSAMVWYGMVWYTAHCASCIMRLSFIFQAGVACLPDVLGNAKLG